MRYAVLILGGYGNFGRRVAARLASSDRIRLLIAGRSEDRASAFATKLCSDNPLAQAEAYPLDILSGELVSRIRASAARLVIHTSGPFQGQDYRVAEA